MKLLKELSEWYKSQCDDLWEHRYGVAITTLDNPGWFVKIDLVGTSLENVGFTKRTFNTESQDSTDENDWYNVEIKDNQFQGAGGPDKLELILTIFLNWSKEVNP